MADDNHQPDLPTPPKGAKAPAAYAPRPRAAGEDDASAEANAKVAADIAASASRPIPAEQLVTQPTSGTLAEGRAMWIIVGPYKGSVLVMPDAEAEDAKDSHWAINMSDMAPPFDANAPLDHDHELTDEDRAYALEAANTWAAAQNPPPEPPPPEGEATAKQKPTATPATKPAPAKSMEPKPASTYETK